MERGTLLSRHQPPLFNFRMDVLSQEGAQQTRTMAAETMQKLMARSEKLIALSSLFTVVQVGAVCFVLMQSWDKPCDRPLQMYLLVEACRRVADALLTFQQRRFGFVQTREVVTTVDRLQSLLNTFTMIWFFFGQWWILRTETCEVTNPDVYQLSLVFLLLTYSWSVILLCGLACLACSLPAVLAAVQVFAVHSEEEEFAVQLVQSFPDVNFDSRRAGEGTCCICLEDYQSDSTLKLLPCNHHFHQSCIERWLMSGLCHFCPLCRRPITLEQTM